ncbi:MAG TPA: hypothetical protein VGD80_21045, partial [Kofleriaceae bacterium]
LVASSSRRRDAVVDEAGELAPLGLGLVAVVEPAVVVAVERAEPARHARRHLLGPDHPVTVGVEPAERTGARAAPFAAVIGHLQLAGEPAERADGVPALLRLEPAVVVAIESFEQELAELTALRSGLGVGGGQSQRKRQRGHQCKGCELHARLTRAVRKR